MKYITLLLIMVLASIASSMQAQDRQSLLVQYKDGGRVLIDLPATAKRGQKDNSVVATPYGYNLRLQGQKITKRSFVTPQFITDSLISNVIRVTCFKDKVTLTNSNNTEFSHLLDRQFHQLKTYAPTEHAIDLDLTDRKPGLYWLSHSYALIGIDTASKKKK